MYASCAAVSRLSGSPSPTRLPSSPALPRPTPAGGGAAAEHVPLFPPSIPFVPPPGPLSEISPAAGLSKSRRLFFSRRVAQPQALASVAFDSARLGRQVKVRKA